MWLGLSSTPHNSCVRVQEMTLTRKRGKSHANEGIQQAIKVQKESSFHESDDEGGEVPQPNRPRVEVILQPAPMDVSKALANLPSRLQACVRNAVQGCCKYG